MVNLQYLTLGHHNVLFCENCTDSNKIYSERGKCIGSVNLLVSSAWVQVQSGQINDYTIGICCFSAVTFRIALESE
jgi:hypothetical protein